jgi:hypothetical protein
MLGNGHLQPLGIGGQRSRKTGAHTVPVRLERGLKVHEVSGPRQGYRAEATHVGSRASSRRHSHHGHYFSCCGTSEVCRDCCYPTPPELMQN